MAGKTMELQCRLAAERPSGRFRTACTVMLDTLANRTYDLRVESLKQASKKAKEEHPRLAPTVSFGTRYLFWLGMAWLERLISRHTGPTISCSLVYSQPFVSSYVANRIREAGKERKEGQSKPSVATYSGTFALLELASIPAFVFTADRLVRAMSDGVVSPLAAAVSVAAATVVANTLEYLGFRAIWKRGVLRGMPQGTVRDEARGFLSEFKPLELFSSLHKPNPAKTAREYIGQLWGVIEKHFIWAQALRPAFAAAMVLVLSIQPRVFVDKLFTNMAACGFGFMIGALTAKYLDNISHKIDENNGASKPG